MDDDRRALGRAGEQAADKFLRQQHYVIVTRNYRCHVGEIDLVALDGSTVVFIEVKTRRQSDFGSPFDAVDQRKQRQIQRAARYYIAQNHLHDRDARFDVVGVWWENGAARCELIRNAFSVG